MALFQRLTATSSAAGGLCRTCTWGTVRAGFFRDETETFCRLINPGKRLRFAVRDCTDYCDRRVPANATPGERKYGFVSEIRLNSDESHSAPAGKSPKPDT